MTKEQITQALGWLLTYAEINARYYEKCQQVDCDDYHKWLSVAGHIEPCHEDCRKPIPPVPVCDYIYRIAEFTHQLSEIERTEKRPANLDLMDEAQREVQQKVCTP